MLSQDWWWRSIFFLPQVAALQLMHFVQEFPECTATTNLINLHFSTTNVPCHSESYLLGQFHLDFFIDRHGRMLLKLLWPDCWTYGDNSRLFRIIIRTLFMDNWTSNRVQLQPNEIAQFCWAFSDFSKASYYQHLIRFWSGRSQKRRCSRGGAPLSQILFVFWWQNQFPHNFIHYYAAGTKWDLRASSKNDKFLLKSRGRE